MAERSAETLLGTLLRASFDYGNAWRQPLRVHRYFPAREFRRHVSGIFLL